MDGEEEQGEVIAEDVVVPPTLQSHISSPHSREDPSNLEGESCSDASETPTPQQAAAATVAAAETAAADKSDHGADTVQRSVAGKEGRLATAGRADERTLAGTQQTELAVMQKEEVEVDNCVVGRGGGGTKYWTISPLWSAEEEEMQGAVTVDFGESLFSLLFGRQAHQAGLLFFKTHRKLSRGSGAVFNAGFASLVLTVLVSEPYGIALSIFGFVAMFQGCLQQFFSVNPKLFKLLLKSSKCWSCVITVLILWSTVSVLLGGIRGAMFFAVALTAGIFCRAFDDSFHFFYRSTSDTAFWAFTLSMIQLAVVTVSVVLNDFEGGHSLRWTIGSRQLTGEDIVLQVAGTNILLDLQYVIASSTGQKLLGRKKKEKNPSGSTMERRRIFPCHTIQWPLVLQPVDGALTAEGGSLPPSTEAHQCRDQTRSGKQDSRHKASFSARVAPSTTPEVEARNSGKEEGKQSIDFDKSAAPFADKTKLIITQPKDLRLSSEESALTLFFRTCGRRLPTKTWRLAVESHQTDSAAILPALKASKISPGLVMERAREAVLGPRLAGPSPINAPTERRRCQSGCGGGNWDLWRCRLIQLFICSGVAGLLPLLIYLGSERKRSGEGSMLSWLSPAVAVLVLLWNGASLALLSSTWNVQMIRLVIRSAFDLWFLVFQAVALFLSLLDALEYDERSLSILVWCLLYLACLFSDAILPQEETDGGGAGEQRKKIGGVSKIITKNFVGLGVLLPLLVVQCWLLYSMTFDSENTLHLRFRRVFQVSKQEEGGEGGEGDHPSYSVAGLLLDISTDSFIIARQTSLLLFTLPLLHHLVVVCSSSSRHLFFLRGFVSYEIITHMPRSPPSPPVKSKVIAQSTSDHP